MSCHSVSIREVIQRLLSISGVRHANRIPHARVRKTGVIGKLPLASWPSVSYAHNSTH